MRVRGMCLDRCLGALLVVVAFAASGCSDDPAAACPNCQGCCAEGKCMAGDAQTACGRGGAACVQCTAQQTCSKEGACTSGPSTCSQTCTGCCTEQGRCLGFTEQTFVNCGSGGGPCGTCDSGGKCENGTCVTGQCASAFCASGCCTASKTCLKPAQQSTSACGKGASTCGPCQPGEACQDGACGGGTCNGTTCSTGCCAAQGQCLAYAAQSIANCGASGSQCTACASDQKCTSGICGK